MNRWSMGDFWGRETLLCNSRLQCDGRYLSFYICANSQDAQYSEGTIRSTMDFAWWWRAIVGSLMVTNAPRWCLGLWMEGGREEAGTLYASIQLRYPSKTMLINKTICFPSGTKYLRSHHLLQICLFFFSGSWAHVYVFVCGCDSWRLITLPSAF